MTTITVRRDMLERVYDVVDSVFNGEPLRSGQIDKAHEELWELLYGERKPRNAPECKECQCPRCVFDVDGKCVQDPETPEECPTEVDLLCCPMRDCYYFEPKEGSA